MQLGEHEAVHTWQLNGCSEWTQQSEHTAPVHVPHPDTQHSDAQHSGTPQHQLGENHTQQSQQQLSENSAPSAQLIGLHPAVCVAPTDSSGTRLHLYVLLPHSNNSNKNNNNNNNSSPAAMTCSNNSSGNPIQGINVATRQQGYWLPTRLLNSCVQTLQQGMKGAAAEAVNNKSGAASFAVLEIELGCVLCPGLVHFEVSE